jgi:cell wall integrity and stress response component
VSAPRITLQANPFRPVYNQFQSDGSCQVNCQDSYAFAVLQGVNCWCSDYAPSEQKQTNLCNDPCPGFPGDSCGNPSAGLYGYIALSIAPSGTVGSASSSTQDSSIASVSSSPSARRHYSPSSSSTSAVETTPTSGASITTLISVVSVQSSVQASSSTVETSSAVTVPASSATTCSTTV